MDFLFDAARAGRNGKRRNSPRPHVRRQYRNIAESRIDVAADLSQREPARIAPRVTTGALAKFARDVSSASKGAVTSPGLLEFAATRSPTASVGAPLGAIRS